MLTHKIRLIAILVFACMSSTVFSQNGYEIKVKIPALKDSSVILAHYFGKENSFVPDDTVKLDKKGTGIFKGPKPLTGGMYIVFFPNRRYFDFLLGDTQNLSIEADTSDLLNGIKFQGSPDNTSFYQYRNLINSKGKMVSMLDEKKKKSSSDQQKDSISKAIGEIDQEVNQYIKNVISDNPKLYISSFLTSVQDIEVPDFPRDSSGNVTDSTFRYRYWHKHYFDNFNLADARLLHTPFYEKKVKHYFEKVVPMIPDSINMEMDQIIEKVRNNEEIYRYMLGLCYVHFANLANQIVGMDAVFVYFAEKYFLPDAKWLDKKTVDNINADIAKIKPNLIGKLAPAIQLIEVPNEHFIIAKTDTAVRSSTQFGSLAALRDIKAKYLVLAFWEADCGHCMKEMPVLYDSVYPRIKDKGVKIIAIHMISTIESKRKWVDFVNKHQMYDWINAVPYREEYRELYNVYSTPVIYLLDESKKIVAKRIGVEQIESILNIEIRKNSGAATK